MISIFSIFFILLVQLYFRKNTGDRVVRNYDRDLQLARKGIITETI